jgi:hypothetical protein
MIGVYPCPLVSLPRAAALAARGLADVIGDEAGGWFWLPPVPLWEPWAAAGLATMSDRANHRSLKAKPPWALCAMLGGTTAPIIGADVG